MFELFGSALRDSVPAGGVVVLGGGLPVGGWVAEFLDFDVLGCGGGDYAVDEDAGEVDVVWVEGSRGDDFFCFDDGETGGFGHDGTEGFGGVSAGFSDMLPGSE